MTGVSKESEIKTKMTVVSKEYEIKTKIELEQWLQLKMLFLLGYNLGIVVYSGRGAGGGGGGGGVGGNWFLVEGVKIWWGEPTRGIFLGVACRGGRGSMSKFSKTLMVSTRKIFNEKNRHELDSFNKIQRITPI